MNGTYSYPLSSCLSSAPSRVVSVTVSASSPLHPSPFSSSYSFAFTHELSPSPNSIISYTHSFSPHSTKQHTALTQTLSETSREPPHHGTASTKYLTTSRSNVHYSFRNKKNNLFTSFIYYSFYD